MTDQKPIRLWPGVVAALALVVTRFALPIAMPDLAILGILGGLACGAIILVWWLLFSRAPWVERVGAIVVMAAALFATSFVVHPSIANGMMGMMLPVFATPILCAALVASLAIARGFSTGGRRVVAVIGVLLASAAFTLIRTGGVTGDGLSDLHWRWTPSPEDRLLAEVRDEPAAPAVAPTPPPGAPSTEAPVVAPPPAETRPQPGTPAAVPTPSEPLTRKPSSDRAEPPASAPPAPAGRATNTTPAEWPGFRGRDRNGVVGGVQIAVDWSTSPPVEVWRRPIGPGWSSFAVDGDVLYTQEQRGEEEIVGAYRVSSGEPVWRHRDPVRFWESNGGAGPRATPTLHGGRVYAFGATGILNALDARSGAVVWSHNVAADTGRRVPDWGFASSPLVVDDVVIVAAAGTLAAYDLASGELRWKGPSYGGSYSSPHHARIGGVDQIVLLGGPGAISVAPASGAVLWVHKWEPGAIVQPALMTNGDVLVNAITATGGVGTRRLAIAQAEGGWNVEERWTSNGLKPYFNDYVIHKGHAYGFDGSILSCIDLEDGTRKWKGGRYGNGQLVLLRDQDVLLVLSEDGELALVGATNDQYKEIARFPALNAKTWNHPVLVGNMLLVRNGEEMAAFRLALAGH